MLEPHQNDHRERNNPDPVFDITASDWDFDEEE